MGRTPPELEGLPSLPEGGEHVWKWFFALSAQRTAGMGLNPITWADIFGWSRLTGIVPKLWELETLLGLDEAFRTVMSEEMK